MRRQKYRTSPGHVIGLVILLVLAVLAYIYFNPDYKQQLTDLPAEMGFSKKTVHIYKWQNEKGEWQLTDKLPPPGIEYEKREYREDVNVLPLPPQLGGE